MKHEFARRLRRDRRLGGWKFRRQQPVGPYIADFICFEAKLIVELDGSQHALPENAAAEEARTAFLEGGGFRILRYWNYDLNENFEGVVDTIFRACHVTQN
jgi:very-short-patch-repair endonuclease